MRAYGLTSPGLQRSNNEDAFLCDAARRLFVVADGMGGHAAGEVASRLAIESIGQFFSQADTMALGAPPTPEDARAAEAARLRDAIATANRRVFKAASENEAQAGMGTTVVAATISGAGDYAVIAHVGDSRIYLFADGELTLLTRDDSWEELAWAQAAAGGPPVAAMPNPRVLTSVLGIRPDVDVHVAGWALSGHGYLLLCSDGLHGPVPHATIESILAGASGPEAGARALIEAALSHGAPDNVTALTIEFGDGERTWPGGGALA
jgi:protein phosphatase